LEQKFDVFTYDFPNLSFQLIGYIFLIIGLLQFNNVIPVFNKGNLLEKEDGNEVGNQATDEKKLNSS
jgi:hypothetical protein